MGTDAANAMRQAPMTVETYFNAAVKYLDGKFGKGFAQANPELVTTFVKTCSEDFAVCMTKIMQDEAFEAQQEAMTRMNPLAAFARSEENGELD